MLLSYHAKKIEDRHRIPWVLLGCAWLIALFLYILMQCISPLLPVLMIDLRLSHSVAGVLYTLPILMIALFSYPFGIISDRVGMEAAIGCGITIALLSSLSRSLSANFTLLAFSTTGFGLGFAMCFPNLPKMVKENFPQQFSGTATGLYTTAIPVGSGLGIALTKPLLAATGDWRQVLMIWSLMVIPVVVLWWIVARMSTKRKGRPGEGFWHGTSAKKQRTTRPPNQIHSESPSSSNIAAKTKLREPSPATRRLISHFPVQFFGPVLIGGLLLSLLNLIFYSTIGWLPTYLSEQGWNPTSAATVTSVISFSEIPAVVLMPMLSDQMGKRRMIIILSFLLIAVCSAIVSLWPSLCWFLSPVFGLTFGGVFALLLALPVEIAEVHDVGRAAGAILSIGYIGALLGPPLTGFLRDMTGLFGVGFMVLMISSIVAAGLSYGLPERTCSRP